MSIPELDFEIQSGTLGGQFTTIEGLLTQVRSQLKETNPFSIGDTSSGSRLAVFLDKLDEVSVSLSYCSVGRCVQYDLS